MKMNSMYFLSLTIFLSGCAFKTVSNISADDQPPVLQANECVIFTKVRTNVDNMSVVMSYENKDKRALEFRDIQGPEDLRVIVIDCDPLYFSFAQYRGYTGGFDYSRVQILLVPKEGKINYLGDLVVEWGGNSLKSALVDREKDTVQEAKIRYPELFSLYKYQKVIHSNL